MGKLGNIAKKVIGTQTVKLDDIVKNFGGVVTINGLSYTEYKGTKIPVFNFVEGEGMNFWGGCKKLRELADALNEEYDGDLQAINEDFLTTGIKIRIGEQVKTKAGNPFRPVATLGEVDLTVSQVGTETEPEVDEETGEVKTPF